MLREARLKSLNYKLKSFWKKKNTFKKYERLVNWFNFDRFKELVYYVIKCCIARPCFHLLWLSASCWKSTTQITFNWVFPLQLFQVKSNLKEHIKSHSEVRTFLCGFCGKALKNRQCLNRFKRFTLFHSNCFNFKSKGTMNFLFLFQFEICRILFSHQKSKLKSKIFKWSNS